MFQSIAELHDYKNTTAKPPHLQMVVIVSLEESREQTLYPAVSP